MSDWWVSGVPLAADLLLLGWAAVAWARLRAVGGPGAWIPALVMADVVVMVQGMGSHRGEAAGAGWLVQAAGCYLALHLAERLGEAARARVEVTAEPDVVRPDQLRGKGTVEHG